MTDERDATIWVVMVVTNKVTPVHYLFVVFTLTKCCTPICFNFPENVPTVKIELFGQFSS